MVGGRAVAFQPLRNDAMAAARPKNETQAWKEVFISVNATRYQNGKIHIVFEKTFLERPKLSLSNDEVEVKQELKRREAYQ